MAHFAIPESEFRIMLDYLERNNTFREARSAQSQEAHADGPILRNHERYYFKTNVGLRELHYVLSRDKGSDGTLKCSYNLSEHWEDCTPLFNDGMQNADIETHVAAAPAGSAHPGGFALTPPAPAEGGSTPSATETLTAADTWNDDYYENSVVWGSSAMVAMSARPTEDRAWNNNGTIDWESIYFMFTGISADPAAYSQIKIAVAQHQPSGWPDPPAMTGISLSACRFSQPPDFDPNDYPTALTPAEMDAEAWGTPATVGFSPAVAHGEYYEFDVTAMVSAVLSDPAWDPATSQIVFRFDPRNTDMTISGETGQFIQDMNGDSKPKLVFAP